MSKFFGTDRLEEDNLKKYDHEVWGPAELSERPYGEHIVLYVLEDSDLDNNIPLMKALKKSSVIRWKGKTAIVCRSNDKIRCAKKMDVFAPDYSESDGYPAEMQTDEAFRKKKDTNERLMESILFNENATVDEDEEL